MPSTLPVGEAAPVDGSLPAAAVAGWGEVPFGFYLHVPFCRVRCGYCDFNTYVPSELRGNDPTETRPALPPRQAKQWGDAVREEIRLARRVLGDGDVPVSTVFFGGGTPTLLPPAELGKVLATIRAEFGLADDAEVTTEANPDSVDATRLDRLRMLGINRISFGMQSAVPSVLATLDRTHDPDRLPDVVNAARLAGFDNLSLDLIYGTPGESLADWSTSLDSAIGLAPDHVSAYALVVEPGTALGRRVRRGELPAPVDDDLADKYEVADERLTASGYRWYELSNWARDEQHECRHNVLYWTGADWWGAGPGAHSHVGGVRWWNVLHPTAYADRLQAGASPAHGRELLGAADRRVERVLLESRLATGLDMGALDSGVPASAVDGLVDDGLVEPTGTGTRIRLTLQGRLLADAVVHRLLP